MLVDLVQVMTRDGVRLDGSLQVPLSTSSRQLPIDSVLLVHGTGGSFYSSRLFDSFVERFLQLGVAVLCINTRGHDLISTAVTTQGGRRLGAAYEVLDECRHDIAAWIEWLIGRGYSHIGLMGHSSGAVKVIYTLAREAHPGVVCLAALSPPRLSYAHFLASAAGTEFAETYATAERHVREGRPATLMEVKVPMQYVITASGYLEKYGPDERYNFLKFVDQLPCPTLITFGSIELETNMAFRGLPELLGPMVAQHGRIRVESIAGADHFYIGVRNEVVSRTEAWIRSTLV